ncbi:MAG: 6-hydroxycyclohex-1-ene-1-carbonyl-CoA dehydrogenase [Myxococcota bacterium]
MAGVAGTRLAGALAVPERVAYVFETGRPLARRVDACPRPAPGEVVVEVAGCGLCHTDIGFLEGSVRPAKEPVVLGHEIVGRVIVAGDGAEELLGRDVIAPAVLPCGDCDVCRRGRGNICREARMIGSALDGGFATHVVLPARPLVPVDLDGTDVELWEVAVVADAVTTPLHALARAGVGPGDHVVVVGVGGLGSFAVQIARARGASVIALDADAERLRRIRDFGAAATVDVRGLDERDARDAARKAATSLGWAPDAWKVFEMSGTPAGQKTAFELLTRRGLLGVVGYTRERVSVRLSNVMALEAEVQGTWGAPPERYPEALALVRTGDVRLRPFVRGFPLAAIDDVIAEARAGRLRERAVFRPQESA